MLHPFGAATAFRRSWMKSLADKMTSDGFDPPQELASARPSEDDAAQLATMTAISLHNYYGIIEHDVQDQVVVVRAGTSVIGPPRQDRCHRRR